MIARGIEAPPRFGVVGTGRMASRMTPTLRAAGARVIAVSSKDASRARAFATRFGLAGSHDDWREMLRRPDIDAVYVANATVEHAEVAIAALEAGKAVLCEKPLAADPVSAAQVINAARLSGRLCMEALWTAFLPAHRRFAELAAKQVCGRPIHLRADFGYPEPQTSRLFAPEAGGVMLDRAVYLVALAIRTMGPVASVQSRVERTGAGVEHTASLTLVHDSGGHSQLCASFSAVLSNAACLSATSGLLTIEEPLLGSESLVVRRKITALDPAGAGDGWRARLSRHLRASPGLRALKRALPQRERERLSYGRDPYLPEARHFLHLMESGARQSEVVPLSLSLDVLRVIDLAHSVGAPQRLRARLS